MDEGGDLKGQTMIFGLPLHIQIHAATGMNPIVVLGKFVSTSEAHWAKLTRKLGDDSAFKSV